MRIVPRRVNGPANFPSPARITLRKLLGSQSSCTDILSPCRKGGHSWVREDVCRSLPNCARRGPVGGHGIAEGVAACAPPRQVGCPGASTSCEARCIRDFRLLMPPRCFRRGQRARQGSPSPCLETRRTRSSFRQANVRSSLGGAQFGQRSWHVGLCVGETRALTAV